MREYQYNEELLDRVFLFGLTGLKKRLKQGENAIGFIAVCTFAIITALLVTSELGSSVAGVAVSVLIGGAIGAGIACFAIPEKKRRRVVKSEFCADAIRNECAVESGKEGSAA